MAREMKDSGIEWLGKIPKDWMTIKGKYVFFSHKNLAGQNAENYDRLALTMNGVIKRSKEDNEGLQPTDFKGYQILRKDDLVFKLIDLQNIQTSRVGYSPYEGLVSPAYICLSCTDILPKFAEKYFLSLWHRHIFNQLGDSGVRSSLNVSDLLNLPIVFPSITEQKRIASFLDTKCTEIDKAIEATKSSIEEYKKLRQAIITEAVTKGLDPNVEMKRIDNQWIKSIPNHCSFSRVGLHFNIILGKMITSNPDSKNNVLAQYVCAANVHFDGVDLSNLKQMWFSENEIEQYAIKNGDLLVVEGGAGAGGCAIVNNIDAKIGIQNSIMIIRGSKGNDVRYLSYLLYTLVNMNYIDIVCNRATIPHFTKDKLENTPYIVFQESEQIAIADYLDTRCAQIDSLIKSKEKLIEELTAYRKSLIFEYVTGKKEVPAV